MYLLPHCRRTQSFARRGDRHAGFLLSAILLQKFPLRLKLDATTE
jgi:hypothetical protein